MNSMALFLSNSIFLGVGLSMDAFSISLVNGMDVPCMPRRQAFCISGTFAFFQALMPILGWYIAHSVLRHCSSLNHYVPWISLLLLAAIGAKMIVEARCPMQERQCKEKIGSVQLLLQAVATSIDALSAGCAIAEYSWSGAFYSAAIIAAVTFIVCSFGVLMGKRIGLKMTRGASVFGGIVLIAVGLQIFLSSRM